MTEFDNRATPRHAVDLCIRAFNARQRLPACVNIAGTHFETGSFLRSLLHSSAAETECAPSFMRDVPGYQANQLGPQAHDLAAAAEAEGLLDPEPPRSGPAPHPLSLEAQVGRRPKVYRGQPTPAPTVPVHLASSGETFSPEGIRGQQSGGMYAAAAFTDQTSADEPAQIAEGPTRRSRKG